MAGLSPRRQIAKYAKKIKAPVDASLVADADKFIDEALHLLETEEPELMDWLNAPDMRKVVDATVMAIFGAIVQDVRRGMPVNHTLGPIRALLYRGIATTAVEATMKERKPIWESILDRPR